MGQKDITEKVLEDYNDVFADIINGLLFDGVQEIKPEALENTTVHAQYKAEDGKVHELERDIAKYWKEEKVELAICGIENQSKVEKNMPFRIVGYDGTAYRSQLQQERKKMLPVVTIVLYFGTDRHWNSRKKIKELMEIPRCLDTYVNDYQMHVFEVAWLTEEQISHFRSDFKVVANFFVQKRKNKDYIPDDPTEIRHVDEVLKLLQVMTGDRRYEEIFRKKKEGVHSMCDVAERLEQIKGSVFFRKLFLLAFVTGLILFKTLLNRNLWMNPLSDIMGGWDIWETVNGEQKLTTECIENVIMMMPFSTVVMWTFQEKTGNNWKKILWQSGKIAFIFSVSIEMLQLLLRLGTFQLSDIFYNTVGGVFGGLMYCAVMKTRKHL